MFIMAKKRTRNVTVWETSLRRLRESLGEKVSQADAAALAGVKTRTWISWENSQAVPSSSSAALLRLKFPKHKFPLS